MAPDRQHRIRRLSWTTKAVAVVLVVVTAVVAWSAFRPFTYHINDASWEAGVVAADGRSLTVSFTGVAPGDDTGSPCWQGYEAVAADAGDRVEVTVQRFQSVTVRHSFRKSSCTAVGYPRTARVDLPAPLAGRRVVDPSLGRDRPIFDGARAAELTDLPAGATLSSETTKPLTRGGAMLVRTYDLGNDRAGSTVELLQSPDRPAPDRGATPTPVTVHDGPAQYVQTEGRAYVEWQEHDQWLRLTTTGAALPEELLVAIAEGARVP